MIYERSLICRKNKCDHSKNIKNGEILISPFGGFIYSSSAAGNNIKIDSFNKFTMSSRMSES